MLKEYFKIALKNLRTRRLRSWLTIIGVVIGVFLIISLLSLTEGLKTAVLDQLKMMGEDLVIIMPGEITNLVTSMAGDMELTDEDAGKFPYKAVPEKLGTFLMRQESLLNLMNFEPNVTLENLSFGTVSLIMSM